MTRILRALSLGLSLIVLAPDAVAAQPHPWYRRTRLEGAYQLRGTKILVVAGGNFNHAETIEMAECWKRWGAQVDFAGPERTLEAEPEEGPATQAPAAPPALRVGWLISEADPSRYDVLYVAGGEGVGRLLGDRRQELARLIDGVHARGGIVSAICHGPMALAASTLVRGRRLTVQGTPQRQALEQAGAVIVDEIAVVDGALVTGQWPHLEEFAVTVAERVQYPGGGGPREKALAARSPIERALDDLRDTYAFDGRAVPQDALDTLLHAAQRAVAPRGSSGPRTMRFVAVREGELKGQLSNRIHEKSRPSFVAMGMPEAVVRTQIGRLIEGTPMLLFQFVEVPSGLSAEARERALRTDTAFAGAAASNLTLVARSMGLGVAAIGMPPFLAAEVDIREILQVPDTHALVGIYGLGYSAVNGTPAAARPGSDLLFLERWAGGKVAAPR